MSRGKDEKRRQKNLFLIILIIWGMNLADSAHRLLKRNFIFVISPRA